MAGARVDRDGGGVPVAGSDGLERMVDLHDGAMHRLARLGGRGEADGDGAGVADAAVARAWSAALADAAGPPEGVGERAWLLGHVLEQLPPLADHDPVSPLVSAPEDFEDEHGRWAGWWRDGLP